MKEITHENYKCSLGACPAVYEETRCQAGTCPEVIDNYEPGKFVFIGQRLDPLPKDLAGKVSESEAAVSLDKQLVLALLGLTDLVEAAEPIIKALEVREQRRPEPPLPDDFDLTISLGQARALRATISKIKSE